MNKLQEMSQQSKMQHYLGEQYNYSNSINTINSIIPIKIDFDYLNGVDKHDKEHDALHVCLNKQTQTLIAFHVQTAHHQLNVRHFSKNTGVFC